MLPSSDATAMSLSEAMSRAATQSENAALVELEVARARASEQTALGAILPTATVGFSSVRNSDQVSVGDSQFVALWDHEFSMRAGVDIFRGTSIPTWAAARMGADAATERATWQSAGLRVAAARAYLGALSAVENLSAARDAIELRTTSMEQVGLLIDAGYAVEADRSRAELSLIEAQSAELGAQRELDDWLSQLTLLIDAPIEASDLEAPTLPAPAAMESQPGDLRALGIEVDVAERLVRAQQLTFLPVLSLSAQYTVGAQSLRSPDGRSWFATFNASWDLFDYARYGRLAAARVALSDAELRVSQAERSRRSELEMAQRSVEVARAQLQLSDAGARVAQQTRALEAERFSGGDLTVLELVAADSDVFRAEVTRNRAALTLATAQVELAFLRGQLEDDSWLSE